MTTNDQRLSKMARHGAVRPWFARPGRCSTVLVKHAPLESTREGAKPHWKSAHISLFPTCEGSMEDEDRHKTTWEGLIPVGIFGCKSLDAYAQGLPK